MIKLHPLKNVNFIYQYDPAVREKYQSGQAFVDYINGIHNGLPEDLLDPEIAATDPPTIFTLCPLTNAQLDKYDDLHRVSSSAAMRYAIRHGLAEFTPFMAAQDFREANSPMIEIRHCYKNGNKEEGMEDSILDFLARFGGLPDALSLAILTISRYG